MTIRSFSLGLAAGISVLLLSVGGCSQNVAASKPAASASVSEAPTSVSPDQALKMLKDGNARYVAGRAQHPNQSTSRRAALAGGQHPYAIVLSCSDSRVPPELVFDAGLGDLFVVRVAGNTADDGAIGSIEYAVEHLGASLIVVLGHENCGAVKAAMATVQAGSTPPGHLPAVVDPIRQAVADARGVQGDEVHNTVRANVKRVVEQLEASRPVLAERVASGKLKIVGGVYDLDTGKVE